jgi:hypothetical protein
MRSLRFAIGLVAMLAPRFVSAYSIVDPGQGPVALVDAAGIAPHELSGLSWLPDTSSYFAVSDDQPLVYRLEVDIDATTGTISSATTVSSIALSQSDGAPFPIASDIEGVALGAGGMSVFVSEESGPVIREHALDTGRALAEVGPASAAALAVFVNRRTNLGWESLTRAPDSGDFWTANEEALSVDGPAGGGNTSTLVRLQQLGPELAPISQWAYRVSGDIVAGTIGNTNGGVSDLVALPGGALLVLERSAGLVAYPNIDLRNRIFLVDFGTASDVTEIGALTGGGFTEVTKTLLWEAIFPDDNFEGIALGPPLASGDRSLLLVSDDGAGLNTSLYALRLVAPEPARALLIGASCIAIAALRRIRT